MPTSLALRLFYVFFSVTHAAMVNNTNAAVPAPFVVAPTGEWDGIDGKWSTFSLSVSTPPQHFRVLPATNGQNVYIPGVGACRPQDPTFCPDIRGMEDGIPFNQNQSSTWKLIGIYGAWNWPQNDLNVTGNALFGFDTVDIPGGNANGSDHLNATDQPIGAYVTQKNWLGQIPLDIAPNQFEESKWYPSFLDALLKANQIPSRTYSYTAGAYYRTPKYSGSLILGGYDASRYKDTPGNSSFPFDDNEQRWTSVGVSGIYASNVLNISQAVLSVSPYKAFIDSSTSWIWLPREACDRFEKAFGLTFEPRTGLYLVNDTIHERLRELNPTITFQLGNSNDSTTAVNIEFPYAAFDMQVGWPYFNDTQNYFPIKRAENSTQYTLGRTFLQEAYLITDYSRGWFYIQQARFEESIPEPDIQTIPQAIYDNSTNTTSTPSPFIPKASNSQPDRLSTPTVAGITVGSVLGAAALLVFLLLYLRRRHKAIPPKIDAHDASIDHEIPPEMEGATLYEAPQYHAEVAGPKVQYEMDSNALHLMSDDSNGRHCLSDDHIMHEMPSTNWARSGQLQNKR